MIIIRHPYNSLNNVWHYPQVTTYWQKLAWPDEAEGNGIAKQLLQQCCSLGLLYTKLVITKLEVILQEKTDPKLMLLSAEVSFVLKNKMKIDWLWSRINMWEIVSCLYLGNIQIRVGNFCILVRVVWQVGNVCKHSKEYIYEKKHFNMNGEWRNLFKHKSIYRRSRKSPHSN